MEDCLSEEKRDVTAPTVPEPVVRVYEPPPLNSIEQVVESAVNACLTLTAAFVSH
jgi:hypothetical protein